MKSRQGNYDTFRYVKVFAKENRDNMTLAENRLWEELKASKLGIRFRRQFIIGDYIADFACIKCNLVVEVDGEYHNDPKQKESDDYRDWYMQQRGFKVLRFTNEQVINDIESVMSKIIHSL